MEPCPATLTYVSVNYECLKLLDRSALRPLHHINAIGEVASATTTLLFVTTALLLAVCEAVNLS